MDLQGKNYVEKHLLKLFLTEGEALVGQRHTNARSLTLMCGGVSIVWSTTTRHESVMPLLSLSPLNVLTH